MGAFLNCSRTVAVVFFLAGGGVPQISYFDSLTVARRTWPELENHRLTCLGEHFGIVYNAHDALDDSRTCGKIIALAAEKWGVDDVDGLLQACGIYKKTELIIPCRGVSD